MSVQDGLNSQDPETIKKGRGAAKGRVTNFVNRIPGLLKKDKVGKFIHDEIDEAEVSDVVGKMEECLHSL